MAEFKVIESQEEFDNRIKERIERAEKKVREEFKGWLSPDEQKKLKSDYDAEVQKLNEAHSKELEKYAGYDEKFAEQSSKIHSLETSALKTKIAIDKKLPFDAVEFLTGEDEESISASADKLLKLSGTHTVGFTRNTECPNDGGKEQQWRDLSRSLQKD